MIELDLIYNPAARLIAPRAYWGLGPERKAQICNGAGPKGKGWTVPDTMYGKRVTEPCNVHDYMYHVGESILDKMVADLVLLINLLLTIVPLHEPTWRAWCPLKTSPLTWWRCKRALVYFLAVWWHGWEPFKAGKNPAGARQ